MIHPRARKWLLTIDIISITILSIIFLWYLAPKAQAYNLQGEFLSSKLDIIDDVMTKLPHNDFDLISETGRFTCGRTDRALGCYTWRQDFRKIEVDQTLEDYYFKNVLLHEVGHYLYNRTTEASLWESVAWEFMQDFRRTFDEITGPEVKIVNNKGYLIAASGIYDLGLITADDIEKIKAGQPFITPERKQKITFLPKGEVYSLEDVRSGIFGFSGRL